MEIPENGIPEDVASVLCLNLPNEDFILSWFS